jgi:hypothetical protein
MTLNDELRIKKLLCTPEKCECREIATDVFGYQTHAKCPIRSLVTAAYNQERAFKEFQAYKLEYPDE